ncbi:hypothetical protein Pmar_PMAR015769, partial [Perkinsus marinus ATCC 50983]
MFSCILCDAPTRICTHADLSAASEYQIVDHTESDTRVADDCSVGQDDDAQAIDLQQNDELVRIKQEENFKLSYESAVSAQEGNDRHPYDDGDAVAHEVTLETVKVVMDDEGTNQPVAVMARAPR